MVLLLDVERHRLDAELLQPVATDDRGDRLAHTIPELLHGRLSSEPDSPYLDICGTAFTAAEIADNGWRLANALADLGVGKGDRVSSLVESSPEGTLVNARAHSSGESAWFSAGSRNSISRYRLPGAGLVRHSMRAGQSVSASR